MEILWNISQALNLVRNNWDDGRLLDPDYFSYEKVSVSLNILKF